MGYYYITFRSVTFAQRGEQILNTNGIRCTLQRTPHWMEEQGCGYCLGLKEADIRQAVELLRKMDIPMRKVYVRLEDGIMKEMPV